MAMYKGGAEIVALQDTKCYLPTEDEIKREAAAIRAGWNERTLRKRRSLQGCVPVASLEPIQMVLDQGASLRLASMRPRIA